MKFHKNLTLCLFFNATTKCNLYIGQEYNKLIIITLLLPLLTPSEAENLFNCPYTIKGMCRLDFMLDFYYDPLIFKEL